MRGFELIKAAADQAQCGAILSKIYGECPSHFPYGLRMEQHDELCMIRKQASGEVVGFTGWQERTEPSGRKIGYYTIGILPEHRNMGFAKQAVASMIGRHKDRVDQIRAAIVPENTPSLSLARCLGVPIQTRF